MPGLKTVWPFAFVDLVFLFGKSLTHRSKSHVDSIEVGGEVALDSNAAAPHALVEGAVSKDEDFWMNSGRHCCSALPPTSSTSLLHFRIVVVCGQFNA